MRAAVAVAAVAAAAAIALAGCRVEIGSDGNGVRLSVPPAARVAKIEELRTTVGEARSIAVETAAGDISLAPTETLGQASVRATVWAPSDEDLRRVRVVLETRDGVLRVGYEVDGDRHGIAVAFEVAAPPDLPARLRSSAGTIRVGGWGAAVAARTSAGDVHTEVVAGDQDLSSSAGSILVSAAEGAVNAETGAGDVRVAGRLRGDCSLRSSAGRVEVFLPTDSRLRFSGSTSAGSVRCAFRVTLVERPVGGGFEGVVGDGGEGTLRLRSSAGDVVVESISGVPRLPGR